MNRDYSLGSYASKTEAAISYNIGSVEFHGPFGRLNDMDKSPKQTDSFGFVSRETRLSWNEDTTKEAKM
jgi:hypothetical protein